MSAWRCAPDQRRPASIEPGVRLSVTTPDGEEEAFDAAGATRAESEVLARWLTDEVLSHPSMKPGHVALLFRKLTQADAYLDAFAGIQTYPYVIEGEKHFYRRQEVIDLVNLLRILEHPRRRDRLDRPPSFTAWGPDGSGTLRAQAGGAFQLSPRSASGRMAPCPCCCCSAAVRTPRLASPGHSSAAIGRGHRAAV